jgi:hypothetical protein
MKIEMERTEVEKVYNLIILGMLISVEERINAEV